MASLGLRVLGVAQSVLNHGALPSIQHDFPFEFTGLIGLADPVRESVPEAVRTCYDAGIRVVMITGDYPGTAQNIAREIGLKNSDICITGKELDAMSDAELREKIKTINLFCRVVPEQKLRIVEALKSNGEVVAMTGDGVNDAPALKSASIGIAMGGRGTDVARESSSLVLLDDDFSSIVEAVRSGRRIFDNLKKAMAYIISIHIPIAGMSLLPIQPRSLAGSKTGSRGLSSMCPPRFGLHGRDAPTRWREIMICCWQHFRSEGSLSGQICQFLPVQ